MDTQKQVIDRLKQANNVLVTVSNNPSVDQLAACIGLSLALNKLDKHATAVFSGNIPSTIEFLKPEDTIEKNTDSLRDFIISLDKSKADKLRYKVEDKVVRIFITPYRTSISDSDLEFSQGDFNVDVVLALGVHEQKELDQAVTAHGRILHDATVVTVNNQEQGGELGSIHWLNTAASSLSEMAATLAMDLSKDILDQQIATALLTGVVAETDRFSNEKTSADTMNISASLMAAGANQQLVATKLQESSEPSSAAPTSDADAPEPEAHINEDGTLEINHDNDENVEPDAPSETPVEDNKPSVTPEEEGPEPPRESKERTRISPAKQSGELTDELSNYKNPRTAVSPPPFSSDTDPNMTNQQEEYVDPLSLPPVDTATPMLDHDAPLSPQSPAVSSAASERDRSNDTLSDIEQEVNSPHLHADPQLQPQPLNAPAWQPSKPAKPPEELNLNDLQRPEGIDEPATDAEEPSVDAARDAVAAAVSSDTSQPLAPVSSLNAQPLGGPLHNAPQQPTSSVGDYSALPLTPAAPDPGAAPAADQPVTMPLPSMPAQPQQGGTPQPPASNAAPVVPPPIIPPTPPQQ